MVFTQGLRHTFVLWQRAQTLVQFPVVQASLASLKPDCCVSSVVFQVLCFKRWVSAEAGRVTSKLRGRKRTPLLSSIIPQTHLFDEGGLFPFDGCWWLGTDVVDHSIDSADGIDDSS